MNDVTLFVAVLSPMSNYCSITFSVTVQSDNDFKKEMWTLQLPETLILCLYVAYIDVFFAGFQWYDVMTKEFGRERLVQRSAILLSPQCGDATPCITQATLQGKTYIMLDNVIYFCFYSICSCIRICILTDASIVRINFYSNLSIVFLRTRIPFTHM